MNITGNESTTDRLVINLLAGDDVLDGFGLPAGLIQLSADGGENDDILIGSAGVDILSGGNGDDVIIGGPGDNFVIQD